MALFRKSKGTTEQVIILDIGSGSVGIAYASIGGKQPKVHFVKRSEFNVSSLPTYAGLKTEVKEGLGAVLETFIATYSKKREWNHAKVFCFLSSPWCISHTTTSAYEKKKSVQITQSFIRDLISTQRDHLRKGALEELDPKERLDLLAHHILDIKLNGYSTKKPEGKVAYTVDLTGYASFVPESVREIIYTSLEKVINPKRVQFVSSPYGMYEALEEMTTLPNDYVFLDVRSELTDVLVIQNKTLSHVASFPFGSHTVLRSCASQSRSTPREVASRLQLYVEDKLEQKEKDTIRETCYSIQKEWNLLFTETVSDLEQYVALPSSYIFTTDKKVSPIVKQIIEGTFTSGAFISPSFIHVDMLPIKSSVVYDKGVEDDQQLSLFAVAAHGIMDM